MSCRLTSDLTCNDGGSSSSSVLMVRMASTSTQATVAHRVLTFLRLSVHIRTTAPGTGFTSTPSLSTKAATCRRCCSVTIVTTKVCRPECRLRTTLTSAAFAHRFSPGDAVGSREDADVKSSAVPHDNKGYERGWQAGALNPEWRSNLFTPRRPRRDQEVVGAN